MNNSQDVRPIQVKLASGILLLYWAFGLVKILLRHHQPNIVLMAVLAAVFGSLLLCIWLLFRGRSWPRWLFLALFAADCWLALGSLHYLSPPSAMGVTLPCVELLGKLLAVVLLFLPAANRWFLGREETA